MEEFFIKAGQMILMLSILVTLHELGHFIPAKYFKTKVEKFYLFFDPYFSLFKKKIGDTTYGIGWLPLGGYVKIAGMIDESMDTDQMKSEPKPWEFRSKPAWQRLIIMLGGVTVNVILAWVIYAIMFTANGMTYLSVDKAQENGLVFSQLGKEIGFQDGDKILTVDGKEQKQFNRLTLDIMLSEEIVVDRNGQQVKLQIQDEQIKQILSTEGRNNFIFPQHNGVVIDSVLDNSAAKTSGLQSGDIIKAINQNPLNITNFTAQIQENKNNKLVMQVERAGILKLVEVNIPDSAKIGVFHRANLNKDIIVTEKFNLMSAIPVAITESFTILNYNIKNLKLLIKPKTEAYKQVAGPIGIARQLPSTWDWGFFWNFTAMFSMWLAFVNLLPIPGLDGGHALFTLAEMITGRKLNDKTMGIVQTFGMIILLSLMALIFGKDIWDLISDKFL
ncbi:RIP metalloprotease RseP [Moheibacter stercoris]|uniref:Zinc metalloprotease n=1 Tax=Moheibacter stercoris TaxID=1628251 RepID=A0ABV2LSC9_9FLAO